MLTTDNTITLDIPAIDLHDRQGEAIMFQLNGLLYTGFSNLEPVHDEHGKWFRVERCMCHGLLEDLEAVENALGRLSTLAAEMEF